VEETVQVIGICFHGIGRPDAGVSADAHEYFVSKDLFLAALDELADRQDVTLSFDDGYASDLGVALQALRERRLTARFFPIAGKLGQPGYLDASEVAELAAAGMTIGSHGMHHRNWRGLDAKASNEEFVLARDMIAAASGQPVTSAACPFGLYDRQVLDSLRRTGYSEVFTSDRARARPGAWLQPRYSVTAADTVQSIRADILAPRPLRERARSALARQVKRQR
jgi:peptidoglycan/xylan/chitin deacetylase (PgdA/CDA1 family)